MLTTENMTINGVNIRLEDNCILMTQSDKIEKLKTSSTQKQFDSQRALAQYIAVTTRPDLCAPTQLIAAGNEPSPQEDYK